MAKEKKKKMRKFKAKPINHVLPNKDQISETAFKKSK